MDAPTFENLDLACAKVGKEIAKQPSGDLHKVLTDTLAVLEGQGPYATFLYLTKALSGPKGTIAKAIREALYTCLKNTPTQKPVLSDRCNDVFPALQEAGADLNKLLLAHDLIRQSLVYARYHARTSQRGEERT